MRDILYCFRDVEAKQAAVAMFGQHGCKVQDLGRTRGMQPCQRGQHGRPRVHLWPPFQHASSPAQPNC